MTFAEKIRGTSAGIAFKSLQARQLTDDEKATYVAEIEYDIKQDEELAQEMEHTAKRIALLVNEYICTGYTKKYHTYGCYNPNNWVEDIPTYIDKYSYDEKTEILSVRDSLYEFADWLRSRAYPMREVYAMLLPITV